MKIKINGGIITAVAMWGSMYVNYWLGLFSIFIPKLTLIQLIFVIDIISVIAIVVNLLKQKLVLSKSQIYTLLIAIIIVISYYVTYLLYDYENKAYKTYGMVLVSQTIVTTLLALFIANSERAQYRIKSSVPYISVLFCFAAIYNTLFAEGTMGGGWINNDNGMNYQVISYLAAFSTVFAEYYILENANVEWTQFFKKRIGKIICLFILMVNVFTVFIAGGRGGLVLILLSTIYTMFVLINRDRTNKKAIIRNVAIIFLLPFVLVGIILMASNSSIKFSGIKRLLDIKFFFSDNGRSLLRNRAISIFNNKPMFGHGLGSDFFEIGTWSHNLFTDLLIEGGVCGLICFVSITILGICISFRLIQNDSTNRIWWMIFAMGFIMSMFSGYYLSNTMLALSITVWINSYTNVTK